MSSKQEKRARAAARQFEPRFDSAFSRQRPPLWRRIVGVILPKVKQSWAEDMAKRNAIYKHSSLKFMARMARKMAASKVGAR